MVKLVIAVLFTTTATLHTTTVFAQQTGPITLAILKPRAAQEVIVALEMDSNSFKLGNKTTPPGPLDKYADYDLSVKKCELIAQELYPNSGFLPYCEFWVAEHKRLGMGEEAWWGLACAAAGISLRCHYRARNGCAGPTDIPGGPIDPKANIRAHCREWIRYYQRGIVGYEAARHVFYPKLAHDWLPGYTKWYMHRTGKRGRIWQRHIEHKAVIEAAYQRGEL